MGGGGLEKLSAGLNGLVKITLDCTVRTCNRGIGHRDWPFNIHERLRTHKVFTKDNIVFLSLLQTVSIKS